MNNVSSHTDLLCELETSLLLRGIQKGEMSNLGSLIGLNKEQRPLGCEYIQYMKDVSEKFKRIGNRYRS
jgi:hypothetical protein